MNNYFHNYFNSNSYALVIITIYIYIFDELDNFNLIIKAIRHQWYWKYEYRDFWSIENFQGEFNQSTTINSELEIDIF